MPDNFHPDQGSLMNHGGQQSINMITHQDASRDHMTQRGKPKTSLERYTFQCAQNLRLNLQKLAGATSPNEKKKYDAIINSLLQRYKRRVDENKLAADQDTIKAHINQISVILQKYLKKREEKMLIKELSHMSCEPVDSNIIGLQQVMEKILIQRENFSSTKQVQQYLLSMPLDPQSHHTQGLKFE